MRTAGSSIATMRKGFYSFVVHESWMASGGVPGEFTTYRDEKWTMPEMAEYLYGGGNFKKLQQIKTEVDPNEMFNTDPQAIPALA
ncbi:Berberine and berberine like domain-containing protein [Phytophthora infestans]|uniref:Berberine and berberine like domain-containing protein n=1 Tax=Phytophthora infestans TaxID=4787 RepID=A0A833SBU8_PHYIN|nr:Berberine and berberine like domain-containing protein [Phytophthora infestans]